MCNPRRTFRWSKLAETGTLLTEVRVRHYQPATGSSRHACLFSTTIRSRGFPAALPEAPCNCPSLPPGTEYSIACAPCRPLPNHSGVSRVYRYETRQNRACSIRGQNCALHNVECGLRCEQLYLHSRNQIVVNLNFEPILFRTHIFQFLLNRQTHTTPIPPIMSQIEAFTKCVAAITMEANAHSKTSTLEKLDALDETKSQTTAAAGAVRVADEPSSTEEHATNRCVGDKATGVVCVLPNTVCARALWRILLGSFSAAYGMDSESGKPNRKARLTT